MQSPGIDAVDLKRLVTGPVETPADNTLPVSRYQELSQVVPQGVRASILEMGVNLAIAIPEVRWLEYSYQNLGHLVEAPFVIRDGWIEGSEAPGHGLILCDKARRRFYLSPGYVFRKVVQSFRDPREFQRNLKGFATLSKYLVRGSFGFGGADERSATASTQTKES